MKRSTMVFRTPLLLMTLAAAVPAHADRWANVKADCQGTTLKVSAHLLDIKGSWEAACARKSGQGVGHGITRRADKCVKNNGMWGEWYVRNHASCRADKGTTWANVHETCTGPTTSRVSALLKNISGSWEAACAVKPADKAVAALGVSGPADKCVKNNGMWGEWYKTGVTHCGPKFEPAKQAGCFGPNRQVYSARLGGHLGKQDWIAACRGTDGPGNLGKPNRCAKDALATGVWGEWYSSEACVKPLAWGSFKDNGCVSNMKTPDANAGGITSEGMRSYSAVLWNAGGDWLEACRQAPAKVKLSDGSIAPFPYPTACVIANANDALGWVTTAVIGAGTAFITAPTGPYAIAATGAAIGLASKAVETGILEAANSNLNVWGVFWVKDAACPAP
ncbi:MAG: hypothetical protein GEV05_28830 [Betaproteobacteria bacterium]|nr:hypothetical protein [Betaproteobacteria bacterium]